MSVPRNDPPRAMIVDDNRLFLFMAQRMLKLAGFGSVDLATCAESALSVLESKKHDFVMADFLLTGMDGLTFVRAVRQFDSDIAIVVVSGDASPNLPRNSIKAGADAFLAKPFDWNALRRCLDEARVHRSSAGTSTVDDSAAEDEGTTALLIDDSTQFRLVTSSVLKSMGFAGVVEAPTANEALQLLKKRKFEVIFCDVALPGMHGLDFVREIHRQGLNTPIFLVTGYRDREVIRTAATLGIKGLLLKPVDWRDVQRRLSAFTPIAAPDSEPAPVPEAADRLLR